MAAAAAATGAAAAASVVLVALLLVPGVALVLCLDLWRLCRRDPDARDRSASNGGHSVLVGNASFIWKKGSEKKPAPPVIAATSITAQEVDPGAAGDGGVPGSTTEPVPDIAAELPYVLPVDADADEPSAGGSPTAPRRRLRSKEPAEGDEDYQSPEEGGDPPYHAPADQLRRSELCEEEPYYAVPVQRTSQPAPLPPPRRRQARVT